MRILSFLLLLSIPAIASPVFAQEAAGSTTEYLDNLVKPGSKLVYGINAGGNEYDFIVTVKAVDGSKGFDWEMTEPVNKKGTVIHTAKALKSGTAMFNFFSGGTTTLDDKTLSVWLSRAVVDALSEKILVPMMIYMDGATKPGKNFGTLPGSVRHEVMVNGRAVSFDEKVTTAMVKNGDTWEEDKSDDTFFAFYSDAKVSIITRISGPFYLELREIRN